MGYSSQIMRFLVYVSINNLINQQKVEYEKLKLSLDYTGFDIYSKDIVRSLKAIVEALKLDIRGFRYLDKIRKRLPFPFYITRCYFLYHITYATWKRVKGRVLVKAKGTSLYSLLEKEHPIIQIDLKEVQRIFTLQDLQVCLVALNNCLLKKREALFNSGLDGDLSPLIFRYGDINRELSHVCSVLKTKAKARYVLCNILARYPFDILERDRKPGKRFITTFENWLKIKRQMKKHFANPKLFQIFSSNEIL